MLNKVEHYFILFLVIEYLWVFNFWDLLTEMYSTEKPYTFLFKDTSLDSVALNPLEILPKQNWVGRLTFLLSALNLQISRWIPILKAYIYLLKIGIHLEIFLLRLVAGRLFWFLNILPTWRQKKYYVIYNVPRELCT